MRRAFLSGHYPDGLFALRDGRNKEKKFWPGAWRYMPMAVNTAFQNFSTVLVRDTSVLEPNNMTTINAKSNANNRQELIDTRKPQKLFHK